MNENEVELVARAVDGDRSAVSHVIALLQDPIYRLALRMVWRPENAEDATQEILIRIVTRLATWRGEATLLTWAYRIGVNYLLNLKRQTLREQQAVTFDEFRDDLADGLADADRPDAELLAHEVRLTCTQSMLQCLARDERIAYVLGEIFELTSADAAWILETTPAAYRKRLERARQGIRTFMSSACGLVNPEAFCRCDRRVRKAIEIGRVDAKRLTLVTHEVAGRDVSEAAAQLSTLHDAAAVFRAHPDYAAPKSKMEAISELLRSGQFSVLS